MSLHIAVAGWLLGRPSGANRRLLALVGAAAAQLQADERITVLHRPDYAPPWQAHGVAWQPVAIPAAPTWRRALAERRLLPPLLQRLGVDLLDHALLPAPPLPCPLVLTIHDLRFADGEGSRSPLLARAVLRRSLQRAAAVVVPSQFTAARLRAHAPRCRLPLHVLPNAVALPAPPPGPAPTAPFLLHVGHLERRKQLDLLLRAMARLPSPPLLLLAGADAGQGPRLRRLAARLGLGERVLFLGSVPDGELSRLYATATAVVLPSRYEGFGLPALEALAAGARVLVADSGALPEVVGAHAEVLPGDPAVWAAALNAALACPAPATPAVAAARRAHALARGWREIAGDLLQVWRLSAPAAAAAAGSPRG